MKGGDDLEEVMVPSLMSDWKPRGIAISYETKAPI
jgi:hypothetical protein